MRLRESARTSGREEAQQNDLPRNHVGLHAEEEDGACLERGAVEVRDLLRQPLVAQRHEQRHERQRDDPRSEQREEHCSASVISDERRLQMDTWTDRGVTVTHKVHGPTNCTRASYSVEPSDLHQPAWKGAGASVAVNEVTAMYPCQPEQKP